MKNKKKALFGVDMAFLAIFILFFALSCSNNSPLEPNISQTAELSKPNADDPLDMVMAEGLISASEGGEIDIIRDGCLHKFIVEPGGLDSDTRIIVESSKGKKKSKAKGKGHDTEIDIVVFDFGPDGLVFNSAAVLDFEMGELNAAATSASMYYFDPSRDDWIYQASSSVTNGRVVFNIDHFSKYAISD